MSRYDAVTAALDAIADQYKGQTEARLAEALSAYIQQMLKGITTREQWDASNIPELAAMAEAALRRSGLGNAADLLADAAIETAQTIDVMLPAVTFTAGEADTFRAALEMKLSGWEDSVLPEMRDWVRDRVAKQVLVPVSDKALAAELAGNLTQWQQHAGTYLETAQNEMTRTAWGLAGRNMNAQLWKYEGVVGPATRQWCLDRLDHGPYTMAEIQVLPSSQGFDPFTGAGGWNCRHRWIPYEG